MAEKERKTGAGMHLAGVLERATPHSPEPRPKAQAEPETPADDQDERSAGAEPETPKGRGGSRKTQTLAARAAKRIKGRTIYLPDDLFERIMVQAHRREMTISDYVASILARQVPDHRTRRSEATDGEAA